MSVSWFIEVGTQQSSYMKPCHLIVNSAILISVFQYNYDGHVVAVIYFNNGPGTTIIISVHSMGILYSGQVTVVY